MLVTPPRHRRVECVPALYIATLDAAGLIPAQAKRVVPKRDATLEEVADLTWLVEWGGSDQGVNGVASYRDVYDYHSGADVREIVFITGDRRACVALLRAMADGARAIDRRIVGAIDFENTAMANLLSRLGYVRTRTYFEDLR
jgi:hypothetical protein